MYPVVQPSHPPLCAYRQSGDEEEVFQLEIDPVNTEETYSLTRQPCCLGVQDSPKPLTGRVRVGTSTLRISGIDTKRADGKRSGDEGKHIC